MSINTLAVSVAVAAVAAAVVVVVIVDDNIGTAMFFGAS